MHPHAVAHIDYAWLLQQQSETKLPIVPAQHCLIPFPGTLKEPTAYNIALCSKLGVKQMVHKQIALIVGVFAMRAIKVHHIYASHHQVGSTFHSIYALHVALHKV